LLKRRIKEQLGKAVAVLRAGGVVAFPTDTAYGLAADATNPEAVKKLYAVKGRRFNKPVHVIFPSFEDLNKTVELTRDAKRIIQKFFPGAVTLVMPLKDQSENWRILSAHSGFLGFRMPDHEIVRSLVKEFGKPITATSANVSGRANTYSVGAIRRQFKKSKLKPGYYVNGGKLKKVTPSTVVKMRGGKIELLREGPVPFSEIKNAIK
jgi:L-threonylcarbamoyladenylate synthase